MRRLTPATVTLLMFVVVGALVAAYVAKKVLFAGTDAPPPIARRNIPTAIVAIEPGTIITDAHLGVAPISVDNIDPQTLVSERVIVGRVARTRIEPLQQIRTDDLYPPGELPEIEVTEGLRAVTVTLRENAQLVDGLVRPGQYVDVHFHPNVDDERLRQGMVMTLFRGVKLLAVNRSVRPTSPDRSGHTATFELSEEQSNVLLLASDNGDVTLSYNPGGKGDGGVSVSREDRAFLDEILGLEPLPEPKRPFLSDHYHGSGRSIHEFRDGREISGRTFGTSNSTRRDDRGSNGNTDRNRDRDDEPRLDPLTAGRRGNKGARTNPRPVTRRSPFTAATDAKTTTN